MLAPAFPNVSNPSLDRRLLGGAALFGVGWGLAGYCPGPGLVSLTSGPGTVLLFVASQFAGMWLFGWWERSRAPAPQPQGGGLSSP